MYIVDVYLVPLLASYCGVILCTIGYCKSHKNLGILVFLWICVIIATILYVLRRRAYKENKKA